MKQEYCIIPINDIHCSLQVYILYFLSLTFSDIVTYKSIGIVFNCLVNNAPMAEIMIFLNFYNSIINLLVLCVVKDINATFVTH